MNEEQVAHYESEFKQHVTRWDEILERNAERMKRGQYSLHWMNTDKATWGRRAKPSSRGLTYTDINNVPGYGDHSREGDLSHFRAARFRPRSNTRTRCRLSTTTRWSSASESWADNVITLYEEAKARQWNATRDIPWSELERLPDDLEKATCQLATFLTEVEFVAEISRPSGFTRFRRTSSK